MKNRRSLDAWIELLSVTVLAAVTRSGELSGSSIGGITFPDSLKRMLSADRGRCAAKAAVSMPVLGISLEQESEGEKNALLYIPIFKAFFKGEMIGACK